MLFASWRKNLPRLTLLPCDRSLNINQTAKGILEANEPPVRMLWVACKNPFAQDFDRSKMEKAFEKLEMVVCADQFFNETVQHADIVLPVTTAFEEWNVDASYWHYWLSINQPAIKPMYEAKCDLEIAVLLSRTINKLEPGSCTFPQEFKHVAIPPVYAACAVRYPFPIHQP